ncbi:MAG: MgtC/SapB family protein [Bacteroidia bacterium]|nr:MgtC/SapB family protein [Bacteroidia bacterium]
MDWALLGTETLRVLAAALLCGLIGLERQFRHKNAGVRTHSLVGMGACLFTIVGMDPRVISVAPSAVDTTRIAAQVVSGIGFLGAGVIFVNRDAVRGMTTAAGISMPFSRYFFAWMRPLWLSNAYCSK